MIQRIIPVIEICPYELSRIRTSDFIRLIISAHESMMSFVIFASSPLQSGLERKPRRKISMPKLIIQTIILNPSIFRKTSMIRFWTNFLDSRKVSRLPDHSESI